MTDRTEALEALAARVRADDRVRDAFLAKSFTDRLLIVDVAEDETVPADIAERLAANDLAEAGEVYRGGADTSSWLGDVGGATRHHFVDVRTRGAHRSYVVE